MDLARAILTPHELKYSVLDTSNLEANTESKKLRYNSTNYSTSTPVVSLCK